MQTLVIRGNVRRVFEVSCKSDAQRAAVDAEQDRYAAEREAFENSRRFRDIDREMRTNRCGWLS